MENAESVCASKKKGKITFLKSKKLNNPLLHFVNKKRRYVYTGMLA